MGSSVIISQMSIIFILSIIKVNTQDLCTTGSIQSPIKINKSLNGAKYISTVFIEETHYNLLDSPVIEVVNINNNGGSSPLLKKFGIFDNTITNNNLPHLGLGYIIISIDGANYKYDAKEIVFKIPSEHSIGQEKASLEVQIVHKLDSAIDNTNNSSISPNLMISLIFLERGTHTSELLRTFRNLKNENPVETADNVETINNDSDITVNTPSNITSIANQQVDDTSNHDILDLNKYIKKTRAYYYYKGSFTSPPCSETVHWLIQNYFYSVSESQMNMIRNIIGEYYPNNNNARDAFNPGNREVFILYTNNFEIDIIFNKTTSNTPLISIIIFIFMLII